MIGNYGWWTTCLISTFVVLAALEGCSGRLSIQSAADWQLYLQETWTTIARLASMPGTFLFSSSFLVVNRRLDISLLSGFMQEKALSFFPDIYHLQFKVSTSRIKEIRVWINDEGTHSHCRPPTGKIMLYFIYFLSASERLAFKLLCSLCMHTMT